MPDLKKLSPMKLGESKAIGEKEFQLTDEGNLLMQVAVPVVKAYDVSSLLKTKAKLQAELTEIDDLLAKHAELLKA